MLLARYLIKLTKKGEALGYNTRLAELKGDERAYDKYASRFYAHLMYFYPTVPFSTSGRVLYFARFYLTLLLYLFSLAFWGWVFFYQMPILFPKNMGYVILGSKMFALAVYIFLAFNYLRKCFYAALFGFFDSYVKVLLDWHINEEDLTIPDFIVKIKKVKRYSMYFWEQIALYVFLALSMSHHWFYGYGKGSGIGNTVIDTAAIWWFFRLLSYIWDLIASSVMSIVDPLQQIIANYNTKNLFK